MQQLGKSLGAVLSAVGNDDQEIVSTSIDEKTTAAGIIIELRKAQRKLRQAAAQLAAITPPANVRAAHEALRRGALEYASELTEIIDVVRGGNFAALGQIAALKGVTDMQTASERITAKGYAIL
jgi:hypothetical protein